MMSITQSESIGDLAAALAKAQAAMKPAAKDSENPHFRSKYADISAVWDACRKPLTDNGLSVVQMPADSEADRVALSTMLLHTSGQWLCSTVSTKLTKNDAQGVGSALTYLRRYALAAMVGVVADEDDDGNAASTTTPTNTTHTNGTANGQTGTASEKQYKMIHGKLKAWQWSEEELVVFAREHQINIKSLRALTGKQASDLITAMLAAEQAPQE